MPWPSTLFQIGDVLPDAERIRRQLRLSSARETLQSDRIKLVPFIPSVHAETYWRHVGDRRKDISRYYPAIFTFEETLSFERFLRRDPHIILFAVLDKTRPDAEHPEWGGSLAGVLTLFETSPAKLSTEIGYVVVFPEFRGTHVAKHMVGVLLRYLLQLPSQSPPGLGVRRVQWLAHPDNALSVGLAQRMGFNVEGRKRWMWVLTQMGHPDEREILLADGLGGT